MRLGSSNNRYIEVGKPALTKGNQRHWDGIFRATPEFLFPTKRSEVSLPDGLLDRYFFRPLNYKWSDAIEFLCANGVVAWRQKPNLLWRTGDLPNVPNGIAPDLVGEIDRDYWQSLYSLDIFDDSELAVFVNRMLTRFRFAGHVDSSVHRYFDFCIDSITDDFAARVKDCLPVDLDYIDGLVDEHSGDDFMSLPYLNDPVHDKVEWRDMLDAILFYISKHSLNEKALDDENDGEEDSESILSKVTLFIDKPALINVVDIDAYLKLCIGSLDRGEELAIDYEVLRLPLNNGSSDMVHDLINKLSSSAVVKITRGKRIVILKKN